MQQDEGVLRTVTSKLAPGGTKSNVRNNGPMIVQFM
eukprot:COSAG02_NODE_4436_length_5358_cov_26.782278_4_plen_36_part_00